MLLVGDNEYNSPIGAWLFCGLFEYGVPYILRHLIFFPVIFARHPLSTNIPLYIMSSSFSIIPVHLLMIAHMFSSYSSCRLAFRELQVYWFISKHLLCQNIHMCICLHTNMSKTPQEMSRYSIGLHSVII